MDSLMKNAKKNKKKKRLKSSLRISFGRIFFYKGSLKN